MVKICVFAGAASGLDPSLSKTVHKIGVMAAARKIGIVYGGGRTGLMGAVADGAISEGGYVHGIIPKFLENLEVGHQGCTTLTITKDMHERKTIMYEESDAFLALPGGFGTMEEVLEIITWRQLRSHQKPIYVYNHKGYWQSIISMWHEASKAGFIKPVHLKLFETVDNLDGIGDIFDQLAAGADS
jgi:uncharacterized protein (TIGR00730 family)